MVRDSRYEILPFGSGIEEATTLSEPVTLTVTSSPRHGLDQSIDVAAALRGHGHAVVPHVPARMVRDHAHLDAALRRLRAAGIDEVFLIGGDAGESHGPFDSAVQLLPTLREHPLRPARIGIGAYPEGHPLIDPATLADALGRKSHLADYVVTQLCFDPQVLVDWLAAARSDGLALPVYVGIPGAVDRRRLLETSIKVGVGQSVSFLRKQRGLRRLFGSPAHAMETLFGALAPRIGDPDLGIAGLHWYTFNRLRDTIAWERAQQVEEEPGWRRQPTG